MGIVQEDNAFMLFILTPKYLERLRVAYSGVRREIDHAVTLAKANQGSKLLFGSLDPAFAIEHIVPELPAELRELCTNGLVFDISDHSGIKSLALRMTRVFSMSEGGVAQPRDHV